MKTRILKITLAFLIVLLVIKYFFPDLFRPSTVKAVGDLVINFHVPQGDPIFVVENMLPGDSEERSIDIRNSGDLPRLVRVKGVKTGGSVGVPIFENILDIVISENSTPIYGAGSSTGPKTLAQFFDESNDADWLFLNVLNPNDEKIYNFHVTFPIQAGNEFQKKAVIFDLIFENYQSNRIVINEVFYNVDGSHGSDSPADNGITVNGLNLGITGNGAGSVNQIFVDIENNCTIYQVNNLNAETNINVNQNTGSNNANGNTTDGNSSISTGSSSSDVSLTTIGNVNKASCNNVKKKNKNHEWIELFNPTDKNINLKNYTITDNSGLVIKISGNKILKEGKFALITKDNSTWNFWNEPQGVLKIELKKQIGDGLNNTGDHLILKRPDGSESDRMSWGNDTTGFTPQSINPQVEIGSSTERLSPGLDTDRKEDWEQQTPPSPGT